MPAAASGLWLELSAGAENLAGTSTRPLESNAESLFLTPEAARPFSDLQSAVDLESFWRANLRLLECVLPHHSCSLMLGIVDYQPQEGRHFVALDQADHNQPLTSLSIAQPYLAAHPKVKMYTYTEMLEEDPGAQARRVERERRFKGWNEFVHLAFWNGAHPEAVLSIRRTEDQGPFSPAERQFLDFLHPVIDAGLRRLRVFEQERGRRLELERFVSGLPIPVMFLGADRQLEFATQEAYDWCAVWNHGFKDARAMNTRRCFQLPARIDAACAELGGGGGGRIAHDAIPRLEAKIEISRPGGNAFVKPGFWVTFACDRTLDGADAELKPEALQCLQALSPSERRVARLVAEGLRNQQVAERLGKSPRTVDFQLNTIYRKLGIGGRTELTRLLS